VVSFCELFRAFTHKCSSVCLTIWAHCSCEPMDVADTIESAAVNLCELVMYSTQEREQSLLL
jgi:hypothetical protein